MKMYKTIIVLSLFSLAVILYIKCETVSKPAAEKLTSQQDIYEGVEFDMPRVKEAVFPDFQINITEYGAVGDGLTDNSEAFANAIAAVAAKGGGKVVVPRGIWLTGPVTLQSNINLHVEEGALIVFSRNFDDYPLVKTSFEGLDTYRCQSPISGKNLENVAITGKGIIDGSGDAWRPVKKEKMTERQWKQLVQSGGVVSDDGKIWYPSEMSKRGDAKDNFNVPNFTDPAQFQTVKDFLRPVMVSLTGCSKVLLDGPTFQNSPAWNIHPLMCEDVIIRNLTVRNPWYSQNGDGLDLESCKNALVYNNHFDVGDDAICFKSGKNEDGRRRNMPTENVIVTNNVVYHGHGGFTIGSEMSGGVRNVHISNCTFVGTDIGIRFKSTRGRGGVVENIFISNIHMTGIPAEAIGFNLFYEGKSPVPESADEEAAVEVKSETYPVDETTPSFRNISMRDITVTSSGTAAIFQGLPEMKLQNIVLENASLEAKEGITMVDTDGITLKNVRLIQQNSVGITLYNSKNILMEDLEAKTNGSASNVRIIGSETEAIRFLDSNIDASNIQRSKEVPGSAVIFKAAL